MPEISQPQPHTTPIRRLRVFLCHSSNDKSIVRTIYQRLLAVGADPWLDEENLLPGQDWELEIRKAVRNSDIVLVCLSSSSINKAGFVQKEIKFVLDVADQQPEGAIFLIPLKLEKCISPDRLSRWQRVNLFEKRGYERLMLSLRARADTLGIPLIPISASVLEEFKLLPEVFTASTNQEAEVIKTLDSTSSQEALPENKWLFFHTLPNPYINKMDKSVIPNGHVSGRRTDIARIVVGGQRAFILLGAPSIGKSALIGYLLQQQTSQTTWSWRNELADLQGQLNLEDIHFVQIDLIPLEGVERSDELFALFVQQCTKGLYYAYQPDQPAYPNHYDLKELRRLLRTISRETPGARYFFMLDSVERLGMPGMPSLPLGGSKAQTPQERGLTLLDRCGAIRTLVDLIDEFNIFGIILSLVSLPRHKLSDQFRHISLDLARFTTMTLQAFTWEDTINFLSQEPENFGTSWAKMFKALGGRYIFSPSEQEWLRQQAGTHPYLLHQFCLYTFRFKQEYASIHGDWPEFQEREKAQLSESINESLSSFLAYIWQRLEDVINKSDQQTKSRFYEFIGLLEHKRADDEMDPTFWYELGPELRYILYSEGIVRYDHLQPIHFPGYAISQYLMQQAKENIQSINPPSTANGGNLIISLPAEQNVSISLSDIEYRLLKTLMQHPERCKEEELMRGAWGMLIERSRFTQRMHQLRRKLKDQGIDTEVIENSYGGFYSLNHKELLRLE